MVATGRHTGNRPLKSHSCVRAVAIWSAARRQDPPSSCLVLDDRYPDYKATHPTLGVYLSGLFEQFRWTIRPEAHLRSGVSFVRYNQTAVRSAMRACRMDSGTTRR